VENIKAVGQSYFQNVSDMHSSVV